MITELNAEQQDAIIPHRNEWLDVAYSCRFDKVAAEKLVKNVYEWAGYDLPKIWHVDSQVMAKVIISMLQTNNIGANIRGNIWDNIWANIWDNIWDNIRDNIRDNIGANIGVNIRDNIWDNIRVNIGDNIWACYYVNWSDLGWVAFCDFFRKNSFPKNCFANIEAWERFDAFATGMKSGVYEIYTYEKVCFVVRPPVKIVKNENLRLHNTNGPAVVFADGVELFAINGRILPDWIWKKRDEITKDQILEERNAEIRAAIYAVLGQKRVFDLIGAKEVCRKDANGETYILYRTKEKIGEKHWQWVGVTCPSTATKYLLGVPDTVTCPIEGVAGTWGLQSKDYIINQHT